MVGAAVLLASDAKALQVLECAVSLAVVTSLVPLLEAVTTDDGVLVWVT
jgi:hypothetical protein